MTLLSRHIYRVLYMRKKTRNVLRYAALGLLCCSFLYWSRSSHVPVVQVPPNVIVSLTEKSDKSSTLQTREFDKPLQNNLIGPFKKIKIRPARDMNRTLGSLDLWGDDPDCSRFEVALLKDKSMEPRALVSFPGSGNRWLRDLLMGLTGVFIGSIYDEGLFESEAGTKYRVNVNCGCTLIQKTHDFSLNDDLYYLPYSKRTHSLEQFNHNGILIIRNPFRAILSYRNFENGGIEGPTSEEQFVGPDWDKHVTQSIASWETLCIVWIRGLKHGGVVYYEDLRDNTARELIRITNLLGIQLINHNRLNCVLRHNRKNAIQRRYKPRFLENPFTTSQRLLILQAIEKVQGVIKERGLDPLPVSRYEYFTPMHEYGVEG